eukprot:1811142-Rhodomonas_salina.1
MIPFCSCPYCRSAFPPREAGHARDGRAPMKRDHSHALPGIPRPNKEYSSVSARCAGCAYPQRISAGLDVKR